MAGAVGSMNVQQYIDEEEELDHTDAGGVDAEVNGHAGGFLSKLTRRHTQVTPDDSKYNSNLHIQLGWSHTDSEMKLH